MTYRILLVDDEDSLRRLYSAFLQHAGYELADVASGAEALLQIPLYHPDAIVTDFRMPGMTGEELGRTIRERGIDIPVIIHTSNSDYEDIAKRVGSLDIDVVYKQPNVDDLVAVLEQRLAS